MKKIICLVFLLGIVSSVFAEKEYVNIYATDLYYTPDNSRGNTIRLTGSLPDGLKHTYNCYTEKIYVAEIMTQLSEYGFDVENITYSGPNGDTNVSYSVYIIMSKEKGSVSTRRGDVNNDYLVDVSDITALANIILYGDKQYSVANEIAKLALLKKNGVLTEEEFQSQKQKLLEK